MRVVEAVIEEKPPKTRLYIHDIGITALPQRFEISANSFAPEVVERTEGVACTLLEILPHTPLGPLGVNITFIEDEPSVDLLDKMRSADAIDEHYRINNTLLSNQIEWGDDVQLNFRRAVSDTSVRFDFNFNYSRSRSQPVAEIVRGALHRHCNEAKEVLAALYDTEDFGDPLIANFDPEQSREATDEQKPV